MLKKILIGLGVVVLGFVLFMVYVLATTRSHSPEAVATHSYDGLELSVKYCQPYKKGRVIFGEESEGALQPNGKYWRLGANDATEITFSADANFGGSPVSAGSYRMYAVPGADSWKVTLNSELGKFGAFEPDYDLDVISVNVAPSTSNTEVEQFTIDFDSDSTGVMMNFNWDKTVVSIPITK